MNTVLTKYIKKPRESKFVWWQALCTNFNFEIEHIKGSEKCIHDFLNRQNIQEQSYLMVIVIEWVSYLSHEMLREIPDCMNWEYYMNSWKLTWELWNTQPLDANIQPHGDIQHLLLEHKVYPKSNKWIHCMVFNHSRHIENLTEDALKLHFKDLNIIWGE